MDHVTRDGPARADTGTSNFSAVPPSQAQTHQVRHSLTTDEPIYWMSSAVAGYDHQEPVKNGSARGGNDSNNAALVVPVDDAHAGLLKAESASPLPMPQPVSRSRAAVKMKKTRAAPPVPAPAPYTAAGTGNSNASSLVGSTMSSTSARRRQPQPKVTGDNGNEEPLSALELRRKRNRESMQRTRVREREEVGKMREALFVMEREYKQALLRQSQQQERNPVRTEYYSLSSESKRLMRENFLLRQNLERRRKGYERMERILADYHLEKTEIDVDALDDEEAITSAFAVFGIARITEDEAFALIARCSQAVERLERTTMNVSMEFESRCFGWRVRRKVIGESGVHFLFTKTYANLDPERAANRAWDIYKTSEKNNMKPIRVLRFETLQIVNENTHVLARDIAHPRHKGVVLRSIFLRFRMQTDKGFVVGRSCMNPDSGSTAHSEPAAAAPLGSNNGHHVGIRFADLTTWLEVNYLDPQRRDQVGCHVKFGGYCDYKTTHDLNERFMDVLFSVVQMENRVLEPLVPLLM